MFFNFLENFKNIFKIKKKIENSIRYQTELFFKKLKTKK